MNTSKQAGRLQSLFVAFALTMGVAPGAPGAPVERAVSGCTLDAPEGFFEALIFPFRVVGHLICQGTTAGNPDAASSASGEPASGAVHPNATVARDAFGPTA